MHKPRTDWQHPRPRNGLAGLLDALAGPGATRAELALQFLTALIAALAALAHARQVAPLWSPLQMIVCGILAFDIGGGIVTCSSSSAKRWFHRDGNGPVFHLKFALKHIVHLVLVYFMLAQGGER